MGDTLRTLLSDLARPRREPLEPVAAEWMTHRSGVLRAQVAVVARALQPSWGPLRVTKDRISSVLACERSVLAPRNTTPPGPAVVLGRMVDIVAQHHVIAGSVPPAMAYDIAVDALWADGDAEALAVLADCEDWVRSNLEEHAVRLARELGPISPAWWPRGERRAEVHLADGAVIASARFDLQLGGPGSGRPSVVVEVKSGGIRAHHHDDARFYALVAALRDGAAPAAVATVWTDTGEVAIEPVRDDVLESAARRLLDATALLVDLAAGRPATMRGQSRCYWCALHRGCAEGQRFVDQRPVDDVAFAVDLDSEDDPGAW
ncbi:MAG: hypothetical protein AB7V43_08035 [Acidimicrobiia bacterium]